MNNLRQFTDGIIKIDNQRVFLTQVFYSGPVDDGIKAGVANLVYDDIFKIKEKDKKFIQGRDFLLVDDVITSGSTMIEGAKILKKAGAKQVWCFALAKVGDTIKS